MTQYQPIKCGKIQNHVPLYMYMHLYYFSEAKCRYNGIVRGALIVHYHGKHYLKGIQKVVAMVMLYHRSMVILYIII